MTYLQYGFRGVDLTKVPQSEPIPGTEPNNAGGYSYPVDEWTQLDRLLVLGAEGGTYYVGERELVGQNAAAVERAIAMDGLRVVRRVVEISDAGRAPKNDPALFVLAMCAGLGDLPTRRAALNALPKVARIGTHLFHWIRYVEQFRGWGRGLRGAVSNWYNRLYPTQLAYQVVKYQSRDKWSHRDLLRLAHPKPTTDAHRLIAGWVTKGWPDVGPEPPSGDHAALTIIWAFEKAKRATSATEVATLVRDFGLPREAIPTEWLKERVVWEALFETLPITAHIRNLATLTRVGLFDSPEYVSRTVDRLRDSETLRNGRVHPIALLSALLTYKAGHSMRGSSTWSPHAKIIDALDEAFYASFAFVEPTGLRYLLALDVSGSMTCGTVADVPGLSPRVASAAMAMVTARTEPEHEIVGFTGGGQSYGWGGYKQSISVFADSFNRGISRLAISPRQRLDDICAYTEDLPFGGTDCALPMLWAIHHKLPFDIFVILTDSETWQGAIAPSVALCEYRREMSIPAKLVVVGMVSNSFSIADPKDAGQLDVCGFDTAVPDVMRDFALAGRT